jgi:uncharacterized protein (TIGR00369 family)
MRAMSAFDSVIATTFGSMSPHMKRVGFEIISLIDGVCLARLPYRPEFVGDITTGVLHGGIVTTLLDTTGGAAVLSALDSPVALATLDLRIDYLRPSVPGRSLVARVECFKKTRNIAFTRGIAYDEQESDPVAAMAATYMLHTQIARAPSQP